MTPPLFMVFDVESIGLHGEGFAVGFVVIDRAGAEQYYGRFACAPETAHGADEGRSWVRDNIPPLRETHNSSQGMRRTFWRHWLEWKAQGAVLVADCAWPVEARFLAACVDDAPSEREWQGPYPLHDLASFMAASGRDPLAANERLPNELPAHDPLADARQSARLLMECLTGSGGPKP